MPLLRDKSLVATRALGGLYARVLTGRKGLAVPAGRGPANNAGSGQLNLANDAHATAVRRTLEETRDSQLLTTTGSSLSNRNSVLFTSPEVTALGRSYLTRAVALDPDDAMARAALGRLQEATQDRERFLVFSTRPRDEWPAALAQMPEGERLSTLVWLAQWEYVTAGYDAEKARPGLNRSKAYAQQALELAAAHHEAPDAAQALFLANIALSLHAFREGDGQLSLRHLDAAAAVPAFISTRSSDLESRLLRALLKAGERETVVRYFEKGAANSAPSDRARLQKAADDVGKGYEPMNFTRSAG